MLPVWGVFRVFGIIERGREMEVMSGMGEKEAQGGRGLEKRTAMSRRLRHAVLCRLTVSRKDDDSTTFRTAARVPRTPLDSLCERLKSFQERLLFLPGKV